MNLPKPVGSDGTKQKTRTKRVFERVRKIKEACILLVIKIVGMNTRR